MSTQPAPDQQQASDSDVAPRVSASAERRPGLTPLTLFLVLLIAYVLIQVELILLLILLALLFATVIERPVQQLERRYVPRAVAILIVYIGILAVVTLLSVLIAPLIAEQASIFVEEAPADLAELEAEWAASANPLLSGPGEQVLERAIAAIEDPPTPPQDAAIGVLTGITGGIVGLLALFVIAFYYLMEKALLRRLVLLEVAPASRARVNRIWDDVEAKVGDWLRGQLTLCVIIGVAAMIGYGALRVPFWPLLGLLAGIMELIPIIGPWLSGIPAVILALTVSWERGLAVAAFIILLQLLENTVLVPRVMRGAVGLTPLTVFVAVLAGTQLAGPLGALLAIPIAAAVQVLLSNYLDIRREANRGEAVSLPGWRWMRGPLPTPPSSSTSEPFDVAEADADAPGGPPGEARPARPPGWLGERFVRATAPRPNGPRVRREEPGAARPVVADDAE